MLSVYLLHGGLYNLPENEPTAFGSTRFSLGEAPYGDKIHQGYDRHTLQRRTRLSGKKSLLWKSTTLAPSDICSSIASSTCARLGTWASIVLPWS